MPDLATTTAGTTSPKVPAGAAGGLGSGSVGVVVSGLVMTTAWYAGLAGPLQALVVGGIPVLLAFIGHAVGSYLAPLLPGKTTADVERLIRSVKADPSVTGALDQLAVDVRDMLDRSGKTLESANGAVQLAAKVLQQQGGLGIVSSGAADVAAAPVQIPTLAGSGGAGELSGLDG